MGCSSSTEAYDAAILLPLQQPIAVFHPKFAAPIPVCLHLKQKLWSWSGDDFTIRDPNTGTPYFRIRGDALSFRRTKTLVDFQGAPIAVMEEPVMSFVRRQEVFTPAMAKKFEITPRITMFDNVLDCVVVDCITGKTHVLGVQGDWLARKTVITCDGIPIAKVFSPINFVQDEYYVNIAPGVDMALIVLLCMALEEAAEERG
ncbi:Aste57867_17609 [Aphanomyces stellatus]|uniref:Aste57867_17609 protein n=1 Tax=Aphanomyces stellatus TaxID=120398 RepID=A0A485L869_9STRA|nr:hypothetical protein As57867_017549 [Aphanomyces stellatus]VFT94360.1 Aste57867_17609 [Aphanomyces stellatus]